MIKLSCWNHAIVLSFCISLCFAKAEPKSLQHILNPWYSCLQCAPMIWSCPDLTLLIELLPPQIGVVHSWAFAENPFGTSCSSQTAFHRESFWDFLLEDDYIFTTIIITTIGIDWRYHFHRSWLKHAKSLFETSCFRVCIYFFTGVYWNHLQLIAAGLSVPALAVSYSRVAPQFDDSCHASWCWALLLSSPNTHWWHYTWQCPSV